jgi:hypothetical protein
MKFTHSTLAIAVASVLAMQTVATAPAGTNVAEKMVTPMTETEPYGNITFGAKFSEDLQTGYVDILSGLFHNNNNALFLNLRGNFGDNDQQLYSVGLGFRHLIDDPGIIIGVNAYYDHIDSENGNGFNQLGLGAEILTKWVDARFNYYLPEDDSVLVRSFTVTNQSRAVTPTFTNGALVQQAVRRTTQKTTFGIFEEAYEGWNAEVGVLVPWVEEWFELRLFAGGYNYQDPRGGDIGGFKARAEARVTEGVTLDLEYWEDEELVGGNWVGGIRVSVPFDIGNLFTGKNPFEGAGEIFHRRKQHSMRDRLDEMVIRSHRIQTGTSDPKPMGTTTTTETQTVTIDRKTMPPVTTPPPPSGGEESPEIPIEGQGEGQGEGPR